MSLRVIRAAAAAERSDDFHVGRLLVLLRAVGGGEGTRPVAGLTKLAKMDFLLEVSERPSPRPPGDWWRCRGCSDQATRT